MTADREQLRQQIAEALTRWAERGLNPNYASFRRPRTVADNALSRADAVLPVLDAAVAAAVRDALEGVADDLDEDARRLNDPVKSPTLTGAAYLVRCKAAAAAPAREQDDTCPSEYGGPGYTHCELAAGHEGSHESAIGNLRRATWGGAR